MKPVIPLTVSGATDDKAAAATDARLLDLLRRYGAFLRRTIVKVCPRELGLSCDDIEQEARVRLWTALKRETEIAYPGSYIYKVAVTATIRAIRQAKARREEPLPEDGFEDGVPSAGSDMDKLPAPSDASPYAVAERQEWTRTIETAMAQLAENRRLAVGLHLQGLTTQEIGELAGWTEPKARNLVSRGLKDLRRCLRALGIEYGR